MAKATKKYVEVEKVVKTTEDVIVLELTKDEADWLRDHLAPLHRVGKSYDVYSALAQPMPADNRPTRVGDKVRILVTDAENATVDRGDVLRVTRVDPGGDIWTEGGWVFGESSSYERVND